jgi:hypothetical protein
MQFEIVDRLQFEQHKLRDEIARLTARVEALERGKDSFPRSQEEKSSSYPTPEPTFREVPETLPEPSAPHFGAEPCDHKLWTEPSSVPSTEQPSATNSVAHPSSANLAEHPAEIPELNLGALMPTGSRR